MCTARTRARNYGLINGERNDEDAFIDRRATRLRKRRDLARFRVFAAVHEGKRTDVRMRGGEYKTRLQTAARRSSTLLAYEVVCAVVTAAAAAALVVGGGGGVVGGW